MSEFNKTNSYSQVVDENRITTFRQQSSLIFSLHFKFVDDNLETKLSLIVSTSLNSIDNKLRLLFSVDLNVIR